MLGEIMSWVVWIVAALLVVIVLRKCICIVPQQRVWVIERLGKYHGTLSAGIHFLVPFVDRVAYIHNMKEIALDVPVQVCITRDNTQLSVDGVIYMQITDPHRASYGVTNLGTAVTQLAQTTLRSVIGKLELDKTFEERATINTQIVEAIDVAAVNWGVKVLRYEIKDLTPPAEILRAMQAQITAEREKRALIAASEGRRQEQINIATGEREAAIARSEGDKQAEINRAEGESARIRTVAAATAEGLAVIAAKLQENGGREAMQLQVAERALDSFSKVASQAKTTLIVPNDLSNVSTLMTSVLAMSNAANGK